MKTFKLIILIVGSVLLGCNQTTGKYALAKNEKSINETTDQEEITQLIRKVYKWQKAQKPSNNELITDEKDNSYIGFNLNQLQLDIDELKATDFFSSEFIDNYLEIHLALDKKLKNRELEWLVGDLPPFGNNANPWCNCQDVPYDSPDPWSLIEIESINLESNKGEMSWKWGQLDRNAGKGWKEFRYTFRVVKENGKWKIAYLEGFNFEEFTRTHY